MAEINRKYSNIGCRKKFEACLESICTVLVDRASKTILTRYHSKQEDEKANQPETSP